MSFDAIIIGAGISGMYQLYRLRELGMKVRVFEAGSDVGGTWYWNRYPGARFDSESWSYGFSFSEELLQEWEWPEHFSAQPDTLRYLNYVADKFNLRREMRFNSKVTAAQFNDDTNMWTVTTETGEQETAQLLIMGLGPLSAYTLPNIPGREDYEGPSYHTARWPHEPVDLHGKRVGIIGTGACGIQAIQTIAKNVGQLTIFQRKPNWAAPLHNSKITPEEQKKIKANYPDIFERCRNTVACFIHNPDPRYTLETQPEVREEFWEKLYSEPGFGIWMGNFRDMMMDQEANRLASDFVAKKIRQRVKDPKIAEKLIPKDHGFGMRRVPLESGYFEVYNQDNVELIDISETPIKRITKKGILTSDRYFEFDFIIYATGFDGVTGPYDRIDIRGAGGRKLKEDWVDTPRTMLGVQAEGYPNMFMVLGPHTARGNIPRNIEEIVDWITDMVKFMRKEGHIRVEPRSEAVQEWGMAVDKVSKLLLSSKIGSWQTGVNQNVPGRDKPRVLGYNGGVFRYRKYGMQVAEGGYKEFTFL